MKSPDRYNNMRPLIWFTAGLLLFLTIGVAVSISRQRTLLLEQVNAYMDAEFALLDAVTSEDLLKHEYAGIRHYLTVFASQCPEIYEIRAIASNGFVLAEYSRRNPSSKFLKRSYCTEQADRTCIIFELTHDLEPMQQKLSALTKKNILASIIFAVAMAIFLWYVLRKTAFIPLEKALEELNKANAGLEERVEERTAEWMRANTELKNEIAEREAAERELVIKDLAMATSVNGIAFVDFDGIITYVNNSCVSMWGYQDQEEIVGRPAVEFWESRETAEMVLGMLKTSGFWFGELVAKRKNGTFFDVQLSADLVKDSNGSPICIMAAVLDITARKRAEDALKDALARTQEEKNKSAAIIAAIGDGISIQDRDFKVLYQNACHRDLVGNHVGEYCYQAYQKRDQVCPGCPVASSFLDGKVYIVERSRMTESGRLHVEISASPLRDASGEIIAGIELVRNITDRKKTEEDVRRAYETQYVINAILRISVDEKSLEEVLLKALDIVLSSSWYIVQSKGAIFLSEGDGDLILKVQRGFDPYIRDTCARVAPGKCLCGRAAQSGEIQFATGFDDRHEVRFEGMPAHGHYCVPIIASGKSLGVLSLCLEDGHPCDAYEQEFLSAVANALAGIIQRKRMEEEREQMILNLQKLLETVSASRREWQETFDSITDMISIHDEEYTIIKANKAFARRFGLEPRDVINKKCHELFQGGHAQIVEYPHRKTLDRQGPVTEEITDPSTGNIFLVSAFPFFSSESQPRGIVHIVRDITEAKENEMRLIMSERLAALGQMASGIAHEINNPLAAIAGCIDGMSRRINRGEYDAVLFRKYLSIIKEELTRSKNITTSMLSVVRKKEYEKKRVNIHNALMKTLEIIGYQGRLKNVDVRKTLAEGMPAVYGSEGELKQVFLIIISNALDAMDDKGILFLETIVNPATVQIAVTDTGKGIVPENLGRIFGPFFTTKSERGGMGLGLSIADRIITAHKGRIRVSSVPGSGTTTIVELAL